MNPWIILGWIVISIIAFVALIVMLVVAGVLVKKAINFGRYIGTRNIPPQEGQVWESNSFLYRIRRLEGQMVIIESGNSSFGRKQEDWKKLVRSNKMRLVSVVKAA